MFYILYLDIPLPILFHPFLLRCFSIPVMSSDFIPVLKILNLAPYQRSAN